MVKVWTIEEVSQNKIVSENGVQKIIPLTDAEKQAKLEKWNSWEAKAPDRKLADIKEIRLQKLKETDFYALQDVIMSNEMKTWRQNLRNIPQDYTTEEEYDLLLARDENGNLTHSVWSKP
jgi:hypothetical protein